MGLLLEERECRQVSETEVPSFDITGRIGNGRLAEGKEVLTKEGDLVLEEEGLTKKGEPLGTSKRIRRPAVADLLEKIPTEFVVSEPELQPSARPKKERALEIRNFLKDQVERLRELSGDAYLGPTLLNSIGDLEPEKSSERSWKAQWDKIKYEAARAVVDEADFLRLPEQMLEEAMSGLRKRCALIQAVWLWQRERADGRERAKKAEEELGRLARIEAVVNLHYFPVGNEAEEEVLVQKKEIEAMITNVNENLKALNGGEVEIPEVQVQAIRGQQELALEVLAEMLEAFGAEVQISESSLLKKQRQFLEMARQASAQIGGGGEKGVFKEPEVGSGLYGKKRPIDELGDGLVEDLKSLSSAEVVGYLLQTGLVSSRTRARLRKAVGGENFQYFEDIDALQRLVEEEQVNGDGAMGRLGRVRPVLPEQLPFCDLVSLLSDLENGSDAVSLGHFSMAAQTMLNMVDLKEQELLFLIDPDLALAEAKKIDGQLNSLAAFRERLQKLSDACEAEDGKPDAWRLDVGLLREGTYRGGDTQDILDLLHPGCWWSNPLLGQATGWQYCSSPLLVKRIPQGLNPDGSPNWRNLALTGCVYPSFQDIFARALGRQWQLATAEVMAENCYSLTNDQFGGVTGALANLLQTGDISSQAINEALATLGLDKEGATRLRMANKASKALGLPERENVFSLEDAMRVAWQIARQRGTLKELEEGDEYRHPLTLALTSGILNPLGQVYLGRDKDLREQVAEVVNKGQPGNQEGLGPVPLGQIAVLDQVMARLGYTSYRLKHSGIQVVGEVKKEEEEGGEFDRKKLRQTLMIKYPLLRETGVDSLLDYHAAIARARTGATGSRVIDSRSLANLSKIYASQNALLLAAAGWGKGFALEYSAEDINKVGFHGKGKDEGAIVIPVNSFFVPAGYKDKSTDQNLTEAIKRVARQKGKSLEEMARLADDYRLIFMLLEAKQVMQIKPRNTDGRTVEDFQMAAVDQMLPILGADDYYLIMREWNSQGIVTKEVPLNTRNGCFVFATRPGEAFRREAEDRERDRDPYRERGGPLTIRIDTAVLQKLGITDELTGRLNWVKPSEENPIYVDAVTDEEMGIFYREKRNPVGPYNVLCGEVARVFKVDMPVELTEKADRLMEAMTIARNKDIRGGLREAQKFVQAILNRAQRKSFSKLVRDEYLVKDGNVWRITDKLILEALINPGRHTAAALKKLGYSL